MKEVREDDNLERGRLRIEIGGEVMAQGSISNVGVVMRSLLHPDAVVFMHPTEADSFRQYLIDLGKRRLN